MKILFITPECPFPPEKSGGVHTVFNLLRSSKGYEIDLIYYGDKDEEAEAELSKYVKSVTYLPMLNPTRLGHIKSIVKKIPYALYQFRVPDSIDVSDYDEVVLDQFTSIQLLNALEGDCKPIVLMHDSMPLYFSRKADLSRTFSGRFYYSLQSRFAECVENELASRCKKFVYVSSCDVDEANSRLRKLTKCQAISLGVDSSANVSPEDIGESIVFTGIMNYGPNEDAAIYFIENVFPAIKDKYPNLMFYIVGKDPTSRLKSISQVNDSIVVTGYVDNVYSYILAATIYVSPLRYGTGVKNKVLEALQCCKASIFSDVSVDGIPEIEDGVNCLIASDTEDWIEKVSLLLDSKEERERIESALRREQIGQKRNWRDSFVALIGE